MTVREAIEITKTYAEKISVGMGGIEVVENALKNVTAIELLGDYEVADIMAIADGNIEIDIKCIPAKAVKEER